MNTKTNRRGFIRMAALSGAGLSFTNFVRGAGEQRATGATISANDEWTIGPLYRPVHEAGKAFVPNRAASWWTSINDLQWPQKYVVDKIKRRADGYAKAGIDTAINFGFHNRFDFSNYFSVIHGYYAQVADELHARGIRWMDHYSCNHVTRPRSEADFRFVNKYERHAVLMIPDPAAAAFAQYEGHLYQGLCEVDLRDGTRGYAKQYQFEAFCHNNPGLHDMHGKYLRRLMKDVPFDGIEVDDMCSYPGNTTCACRWCRDRFGRDYGHEIPPFGEKAFWGDTSDESRMLEWGNYENPVFRDWLRMKSDSVRDHVRLIKSILGEKPLMTCCSDTGPIVLNAVALDLEKMAPHLDMFMLENVGTNIRNIEWVDMDAEALNQKDIAGKRGHCPAIALSYELTEKGAYLGWGLGRFWGASNWSSTLHDRLEEAPPHAIEMEDAISRSNNWEKQYSDLHYWEGRDVVEVRVVNNRWCRENGWRDADGHEHWDRSKAWTIQLVKNNIGYRFVRSEELGDAAALLAEKTPLVLDGVACVSDQQFAAVKRYLAGGGMAFMALPFGTHDEKGFVRKKPLSASLGHFKNLVSVAPAIKEEKSLSQLIASGHLHPILRQVKGDARWAARVRIYDGVGPVIHFMNAGLEAVPDDIKDLSGIPLMKDLTSLVKDNQLEFVVDVSRLKLPDMVLMSPELGGEKRSVSVRSGRMAVTLEGVEIYGVLMPG